jgi:hypothetical protein
MKLSTLFWLCNAIFMHASANAAAAPTPAATAFAQLSALVGNWKSTSGNAHTVNYKLTANNTVLVETWTMSATRESMTLYALDGDRLLATHYCPQGNQPRLAYVNKDRAGKHHFVFLDGTNLQDAKGSHQHSLWLTINSPEKFTRSETYIENSKSKALASDEGEAVTYERVK